MDSILIVGAGAIGMFTACELIRAGLDVTLIDRQKSGQESSWAGGGIVSPLYPWRYPDAITRLARLSQSLYAPMLEEMQALVDKDPEYLPSGMLILGDYAAENPGKWRDEHVINMRQVDAEELSRLAPEVAHAYSSAWWMPEIHQVRNPRLVALLKSYLLARGARFCEDEPVTSILYQGKSAIGVRTEQRELLADRTIIAGGAWTSGLLPAGDCEIDIKPIKGQMLLLKGARETVKHITLAEDRYIIPRQDGRILVGSTTEDSGFDKATSAEVRQSLLDFAVRTIPALRHCSLELHWAGLRPGSRSGIPYIGRHPAIDNLYINSGHYRNGLVLAPASARLISEIILEKPASLPITDYAPCDSLHKQK